MKKVNVMLVIGTAILAVALAGCTGDSTHHPHQQQRQRVPIQVAVRVNPAQAQSLITIAARAASGTSRSMILPMNTVMIWGCPQKK